MTCTEIDDLVKRAAKHFSAIVSQTIGGYTRLDVYTRYTPNGKRFREREPVVALGQNCYLTPKGVVVAERWPITRRVRELIPVGHATLEQHPKVLSRLSELVTSLEQQAAKIERQRALTFAR